MIEATSIVKNVLVADGIGAFGGTANWAIFIPKAPDLPDAAISIAQTGGTSSSPKWLLNEPSIQVSVRGDVRGYQAAEAKMREVMDSLLGVPSQSVGTGDWLIGIVQMGDYGFIGMDQKERPLLVANFKVYFEPSAGDHRQSL